MSREWCEVTAEEPCPSCEKPDWCAWTPDGELLKCERSADAPPGMEFVKPSDGGALFRHAASVPRRRRLGVRNGRKVEATELNWEYESERLRGNLSQERLAGLARELRVRPDALESLGVGWADQDDLRLFHAGGQDWKRDYPEGAFSFPERDGKQHVVGLSLRATDGRKGFPSSALGAHRGIVIPSSLASTPGTVLVVEGPSDVAAALTLGLPAVGRPSNSGGAEALHDPLRDRELLVLGERDEKPDGRWPGRDGMRSIAQKLASARGKPVRAALVPEKSKDLRAWVIERVAAGLDLEDSEGCRLAGQQFLASLHDEARAAEGGPQLAQAELLVRLAEERFRLSRAEDGHPIAIELEGPNIAIPLKGSASALRASLAREFRRRHGGVASSSALADALNTLRGVALEAEPSAVHLRVARHNETIVIDLGDQSGRCVVVSSSGWEILPRSPVLFRRSQLTGALPVPESGGSVEELWELLNVSKSDQELVLGWLLSGYIPDLPHPILLIGGEQGSAKSTNTRTIVSLVDPSPAPLRAQPRNLEEWAIPVSASWLSAFDNISSIPVWWSDLLCKGVTGDGWPKRALYTDDDLAVLAFQRTFILTTIDAGALRGDLGDRILLVDLEPIPPERRATEKELKQRLDRVRGRLFGALLDILVRVLQALPEVRPVELPRMADFAQLLAAMDMVLGTSALAKYIAQGSRISEEVLEGDAVADALGEFVRRTRKSWIGSAAELLKAISPDSVPTGWPRNAKALGGKLRRLAPALRATGISIEPPRKTDKTRRWAVGLDSTRSPEANAWSARSPEDGASTAENRDPDGAVRGGRPSDRPVDRPIRSAPGVGKNGDPGPLGGPGDQFGQSFDVVREAFEERAAILEFDGGLSRDEAERRARARRE